MISAHAAPQHDEVLAATVDGETVLHSLSRGSLHHLDDAATTIWYLLDGDTTLTQLVDLLREAMAVQDRPAVGVVLQDVRALVSQLVAAGLLVS